jgi:hypothetical protein
VNGGDEDEDPREGFPTGSELKWNPQDDQHDREFSKRLDESEREWERERSNRRPSNDEP